MPRPGIGALLAALIVCGTFLGFLGGASLLFKLHDDEKRDESTLILETARAFAIVVDEEFGRIEQELTGLAHADWPHSGDLTAFSRLAATIAPGTQSGWVTLRDRSGRELVNTLPSAGSAPLQDAELALAQDIVATRQPAVSNVFMSSLTQRRVVTVAVPVIDDDEVKYVLEMTLPVEHFEMILQRGNLPPAWMAVIVDRGGFIAARFPPKGKRGSRGRSSVLDEARRHDEAAFSRATFEGVPLSGAFTRSTLSGWSVVVGIATESLEEPFRRTLIALGGIAAVLALAGTIVAWRTMGFITRSLTSLSHAAEALGCAAMPLTPRSGFREVEQIGQRLREAAELLEHRGAERDAALASARLANESLEERVRERTHELADSNRRLTEEMERRQLSEEALAQKRKLEAMGQLTAGMAHDFNNLLTVVIGNLSLLGDLPANGARRRMAQALSAAEHGASLTKQLLAFSRKQTLERRVVNVNTLITGTMPLLRQAVGPLVALDIRSAEGDLAIAVDSAQMELVLLNLALNGRDAMPEGGRLTIATELHRATKDDPNVAPGDWVVIAVSDTGAGMTPTVAARAFEPFFTTKAASTGSGLGLSVVYGVIKQLGGEIALTSEPGKGTTVRIFLPRVPADAVPVERPSTLLSSAMEGARVLIVDDNPEVLDLMSAIMKEAGYEVATAASGRAAVDVFGDGRSFDLVIIDYAMPEMKGTAAARAMAGQRPDVPFLLVSGFADAVPPEEWAADQILPKPFRPGDLRARAQKLIDRAHSASAQPG